MYIPLCQHPLFQKNVEEMIFLYWIILTLCEKPTDHICSGYFRAHYAASVTYMSILMPLSLCTQKSLHQHHILTIVAL